MKTLREIDKDINRLKEHIAALETDHTTPIETKEALQRYYAKTHNKLNKKRNKVIKYIAATEQLLILN